MDEQTADQMMRHMVEIQQNMPMTMHQSAAPVFGIIFILFFMLVFLAVSILMVVAYCKICSKAGYAWALGLLMLVPVANVVLPLVMAFSEWPVEKELKGLKGQ